MHPAASWFILLMLIIVMESHEANADIKADVGFTALKTSLGSAMPDGLNVRAAQVEAPISTGEWMSDPSNSEFQGKTLYDQSGSGGVFSSHATIVGKNFFGNATSMAPGIDTIDCYEVNHFSTNGFLRSTIPWQPAWSAGRVANHSWAGNSSSYSSSILRRIDWVVDRDEYVHVVATPLSGSPLLGSAYNTIVMGRTSGESGIGTIYVDSDYTSGRPTPHLVAPLSYLSGATPWGAAAAVLLIQLGHTTPSLSTDPVVTYKTNRNGDRVYNAERSEVVKALLMAGAERFTRNTSLWDIVNYRVSPEYQSTNGLDKRYGAGQLNIYNSYQILSGGEQNSLEDDPSSGGLTPSVGFDYDPYFGGLDNSNSTASYYFSTDENHTRIAASLVWNLSIHGGSSYSFNGMATLYDLDLHLYDVSEPDNPILMSSSSASGVNHENLFVPLEKNKNYLLQVQKGNGQEDFLWDYAIAFRLMTDGDKDGMPDYFELEYGLNPDDPQDGDQDPDMDGLTNLEEYQYGAHPLNIDSDGDGFSDGEEVSGGYDPIDPLSHPTYEVPAMSLPAVMVLLSSLFVTGVMFLPKKE